jgi:hypothetical protein
VAHDYQFIVWVLGQGIFELRADVVADVRPGAPEAQFGETAVAEVGVDVGERGISEPVAD